MKIAHLCLANFYIDNYGYQENVLPKMHKLQGHTVIIVASTEIFSDNSRLAYTVAKQYESSDGIAVQRLAYCRWLPQAMVRKIRAYKGLFKALHLAKPDIIFIHGLQFLGIVDVVRYLRKSPGVKVFVDNHADYINSATTWLSRNILHRIVYRWCSHQIERYVDTYWATLPLRGRFMNEMYGVPPNRIRLLELGADDTYFDVNDKSIVRQEIRADLEIDQAAFVIISGGKIDKKKNIHLLAKAIDMVSDRPIILILFGKFSADMIDVKKAIEQQNNVVYVGWKSQHEIYRLLQAADLGVFPGTHSVLWEQSCGVGLPCLFKKWPGIDHLGADGNCEYLDDISVEGIADTIVRIYESPSKLRRMKYAAIAKGVRRFSYSNIAKRAIRSCECE